MSLSGIDRITYGVADVAEGKRFFSDWGLSPIEDSGNGVRFETLDGSEIVVRPLDDADLAPAFEEGSTIREVVWGAASEADLAAAVEAVAAVCSVEAGADGIHRCTDPNGLRLGFRLSGRRPAEAEGAPMNTWGSHPRVDRRGTFYERARPVAIGHVVLFTKDLERSEDFYRRALGFVVSDRYPGRATFLRCRAEGGHHDLFLLQLPEPKQGLNHVAFTVRDIHEVFGGGLHVSRRGWETEIGPGRHPVSSAYFWYVKNPCGGLAEYYTDEDYCTADWQPADWENKPENFAEWAIAGGLDGETRRQKTPR